MRTTYRAALVCGLTMSAVLLSGCGGASEDSYEAAPPIASDSVMNEADRGSASIEPQVITTATVFLEVDTVDSAVESVQQLTENTGGSIETQSLYREDDSAGAMMTIRVPADELTGFLAEVEQIGDVRSTDLNSQDVTLEVIDLDARVTTLQDSIARLRELQEQAATVADLVAVEAELATRQSELESLTARRDYLSQQVDRSTVYLNIAEKKVGPTITPDFLGGLQRGWDALLTLGAGLITGIGFLLPTAAVIALLVIAVLAIIPFTRRAWKARNRQDNAEKGRS